MSHFSFVNKVQHKIRKGANTSSKCCLLSATPLKDKGGVTKRFALFLPFFKEVVSIFPLSRKKSFSLHELFAKKREINVQRVSAITLTEYPLESYHRSNQDTCLVHKPAIKEGDWVQAGDLLADCASSLGGELAIGNNILVAYMPWEGYNYEDAILINERLVYDEIYTSIHIEKYELETKETKLGSEHITREIPDVNEKDLKHLDKNGIAKLGSWIEEGSILVGKITPINKKAQSPYQRLLFTLLDKEFKPIKDTSLRAPKGIKATVIKVNVLAYAKENVVISSVATKRKPKKEKALIPPKEALLEASSFKTNIPFDKEKDFSHSIKQQASNPLNEGISRAKKPLKSLTPFNPPFSFRGGKGLIKNKLLLKRFAQLKGKTVAATSLTGVSSISAKELQISGVTTKITQKSAKLRNFSPYPKMILHKIRLGVVSSLMKKLQVFTKQKLLQQILKIQGLSDARLSSILFSSFAAKTSHSPIYIAPYFNGKGAKIKEKENSLKNKHRDNNYTQTSLAKRTNLNVVNIKKTYLNKVLSNNYFKNMVSSKSILINPFFLKTKALFLKKDNNPNISPFQKRQELKELKKLSETRSPIKASKGTGPLGNPTKIDIYLAEKRKIQVGDKMAGRHGNKGIVSRILPRQDMPYLPNGTPVDIVLNPLGVPSRMNVGQIYECLLGLAGKHLGEHYKIFPFDEMYGAEASRSFVFSKLYEARKKTGLNWLFDPNSPGKIRLFDGRTSECFDQPVTVGIAYILKLVHMVDDKMHMRSTGPYSLVTQQPLRGRAKMGGQRLGEMEVWAIEGYGAAFTLLEMLTIKSDDMTGRLTLWSNLIMNNDISIGTPESFKVLICELQALCLDIGLFRFNANSINNTGSFAEKDNLADSLPYNIRTSLKEIDSLINLP